MIRKIPDYIPSFDTPDVSSLIEELGLVLVGSVFFDDHIFDSIIYTRHHRFCDVYRRFLERKKSNSNILCRELYLRNRKRSRHVYASLIDK